MEKLSPGRPRSWSAPVFRCAGLVLIALVAGYLVLGGYLYFTQDSQIYPGALSGERLETKNAIHQAAAYGLVPWNQPTPGTAAPEGYVPRHFSDPAPRGTIVVFHGNGGWAAERTQYPEAFGQRGFRTFLYEYPGYGGRPGRPRESTIVPNARTLIRSLDHEGFGPIYVWGESLGSGVAASVVADPTLPVHGLTLMMPWDTIAGVALFRYPYIPARLFLSDTYDSIGNLAHFQHPICVIRGTEDGIIPPALTLNLYSHLPGPKKMIVQEGYGHGDWPNEPNLSWWDDALDFIAPKK
jgi:pimeloyl-ACP methyl ester carboxylesterase